jgi:Arm DNA-binding domain
MKVKLTERNTDRFRAPKAGSAYYSDTEVRGFGLRVGATGVRAWIIEYSLHGRQRSYVIGRRELFTADAARAEARAKKPAPSLADTVRALKLPGLHEVARPGTAYQTFGKRPARIE